MMRRTGFKPKGYTRKRVETERRTPTVIPGAFKLGAAANDGVVAQPKDEAHRNPRLLTLARGMPCLLRVPGICNRRTDTTVACHSNFAIHGKGKARKAHDEYSAAGCSACHIWLDQGPAPRAEKLAVFMLGHLDQVLIWRQIATDPSRPDADRAAARWALQHLNATPTGEFQ